MNKEDLLKLKKKLQKLSEEENKQRNLYLRKLALGEIQGPPTGYASIDKPWLANYPEFLLSNPREKYDKILDKLMNVWPNEEEDMINYYGSSDIKVKDFFSSVECVAKSLVALGLKEGDSIVTSLESVPEFLYLLLACEIIGCSIKNYIGDVENVINIINNDSNVNYYIAPDYIGESETQMIYNSTNIKNIITIDPLFSVDDKSKVRSNILKEINLKYNKAISKNDKDISWSKFLEIGKDIKCVTPINHDCKLYTGFTSGSTGEPKEVNHTSSSILGILQQMSLFPSHQKERDTWLLTILPPTLVAVVVAMICHPLVDGKKLILDPYCNVEDIDIEMMHYEPNCWGLIPLFFEKLLDSKRIPENYDMSYFKLFGFGAEPLKAKKVLMIQAFLDKHNCKAPLSSGYGQSEGGSDFTVAMGKELLVSGSSGIPLIDTIISIFEPNSEDELTYNQVGEICKSGPGLMLGYSDEEKTKQVLKRHSDGTLWLHTGDYGFMTKQGLLFVLGRSAIKIFPNNMVFPLNLENKILSIDGVKDAIIVSGVDKENIGYEVPYLFIVPEENSNIDNLLTKVAEFIDSELSNEEKPKAIFSIDKTPINKFKTDRRVLQKKYNLN